MPCRVLFLVATLLLAVTLPARAQFGGGPPAVGVTEAKLLPVTETSEFVGRVQAIEKVDLIARVTAFIEQIDFVEGTEVQKGDLLYGLSAARSRPTWRPSRRRWRRSRRCCATPPSR